MQQSTLVFCAAQILESIFRNLDSGSISIQDDVSRHQHLRHNIPQIESGGFHLACVETMLRITNVKISCSLPSYDRLFQQQHASVNLDCLRGELPRSIRTIRLHQRGIDFHAPARPFPLSLILAVFGYIKVVVCLIDNCPHGFQGGFLHHQHSSHIFMFDNADPRCFLALTELPALYTFLGILDGTMVPGSCDGQGGHTALAIAATGYHSAVQYAKERVQGRKFGQGKKAPRVRIIEHEDVRRMLMVQKSTLEAMRAIIYQTYYYFDVAKYSQDEAERERARRRMEVNTPLVKAYCSDTAWQLAAEAIQVHGGYGYSEEYPVARCARDVKILSIWEGTNFIQSLDLIGRKWHMEKGVVFQEWLADIEDFLGKHEDAEELGKEMNILAGALEGYKE